MAGIIPGVFGTVAHACEDDCSDDDSSDSDDDSDDDDEDDAEDCSTPCTSPDGDCPCDDNDSNDDDSSGGGECDGDDEGDNPFHARNGSAVRTTEDLKVSGSTVGKLGLTWKRYHFTGLQRDTKPYFGDAGTWRHSWQYDLYEKSTANSALPSLVLVYPNGRHRTLVPTSAGKWAATPGFPETAIEKDGGVEVTDIRGIKFYFSRNREARNGTRNHYLMTKLTSSYGLVTNLQYDAKGYLTKITEPGGRSLSLAYSDTAISGNQRFVLAQVQQAPGSGQWVEYIVPANLGNRLMRHLRFRAADGTAAAVAEVQFFAPGSTTPLTGTVTGSNASAAAAFDGDTTTSYTGTTDTLSYCGLDLGTTGSKIGRIRVLAKTGQESTLVGAVLEAYTSFPAKVHVLSQVQVSDGHTVNYDYSAIQDSLGGISYAGLTAARYGDGTSASYNYGYANAGSTPLLTEANDPRYKGKLKHVRYAYHQDSFESHNGAIHQEISGDTGAVLSTLEFDKVNNRRIVKYSDLRTVSYTVAETAKNHFVVVDRTDSLGRTKQYKYANPDNTGRLIGTIDHLGRFTQRTRDAQGRLLQVMRDDKVLTKITRDASGRILTITKKDGYTKAYTRDAQGHRVQAKRADGSVVSQTYDSLGKRTTRTLATGGIVTYCHDSRGLRTAKIDANGNKTTYTYDQYDRKTSETDALGRTTRYEYNDRGDITKTTFSDGTTKTITWDNYGHKTAVTDQKGLTTKYTYDELGRVVRQEDSVGHVTSLEYASLPNTCSCSTFSGVPTRIVSPDGSVISRLYDTEGHLLSHTVATGTSAAATTTYTYDDNGNVATVCNPLNQTTQYTYDGDHHRLSQTDAAGHTTLWSYSDAGDPVKITAPDGSVTTNVYDAKHRLIKSIDAAGQVTSYTYDAAGHLLQLIDATGQKFIYIYDANGNRTSIAYPDGKKQTMAYDSANQLIKTVSYDGLTTTYIYDSGGRVLSQSSTVPGSSTPQVQTFTYNSLGSRTSSTDALGHVTRWTYDAQGNVLTVTLPDGSIQATNTYDSQNHLTSTTDAVGQVTRYVYNTAGDLITLTDAKGNTYGFTYDAQHRKTAMTYPDGSQEVWSYDLAGHVVAYTTRAGQTKTLAYNALGQPTTETWAPSSAAPNVAYTYDANSRLTVLDNGVAKLSYTYDVLNRVASETTDVSAVVTGLAPQTVAYGFDGLSRKAYLVYPDGSKVSYSYDALNRLVSLAQGSAGPLASYSYNAHGQVAKLARDNGVETDYTFDMAGQLTDIAHTQGGTTLAAAHYTLDANGRRTAQTREDALQENYSYDATSQLTGVNYGAGKSETFAYDPVGNRTQAALMLAGATTTESYTSNNLNQYLKVNSTALAYDANGNLISDGQLVYGYDSQNRLTSVTSVASGVQNQVHADFAYDAKNRCVLRRYYTKNAQNQWVLNTADSRALTYDSAWNLVSERRLDGTQVGRYVLGLRTDEVLKTSLGSQTYYPLADGLGSTVALTNQSGSVVERYRYTAYGTPTVLKANYQLATIASGYRFLFTGREWIASVQLNDHRNRYYSPSLGRWMTTDPIGFKGKDVNSYRYVENDVNNATDAWGLALIPIGIPVPSPCYGSIKTDCENTCGGKCYVKYCVEFTYMANNTSTGTIDLIQYGVCNCRDTLN